jgi:excisionase family DNA binding protein
MRDNDLGVVRARAFGSYDFRVVDVKLFLKEVAGSDHNFRLDEFADTMRSRIVSVFADAMASANVPVFDVASRYGELGDALLPLINPATRAKYGLEITSFIIENVSVPPEVEQAIDKRSSMAAVGNLNDYVKFQMAQGMEKGGSSGGMATELAVGLSIAQQIMKQQGMGPGGAEPSAPAGAPDLLSPADAAKVLGVAEADVMAVLESGELAGKKIGASWRIKRSAIDEYLAS